MIIAVIAIIAIIALGAFASKNSESIEDAARNLESSVQESTNNEPNAKLVAAYEKVTEGMTKADAEKELGSSTSCTNSSFSGVGTFESCTYGGFEDNVSITVTYQDGAVQSKTKSEY